MYTSRRRIINKIQKVQNCDELERAELQILALFSASSEALESSDGTYSDSSPSCCVSIRFPTSSVFNFRFFVEGALLMLSR